MSTRRERILCGLHNASRSAGVSVSFKTRARRTGHVFVVRQERLILKADTRLRLVPAEERGIAIRADDEGAGSLHSGGMTLLSRTAFQTPAADVAKPRALGSPRLKLGPAVRRAVLTAHIVAGVGLLGDVAAVLAINVRAATTADPELAATSYELLGMFTVLFGIPLSLGAMVTGILLGLGSKWGVVRHGWVAAKLVLLVGVILVGALVLGPGNEAMRTGDGGAQARLIAGAGYDVVALTLATGLSVFKPGRRRRRTLRYVSATPRPGSSPAP
jgi:hypothetical protein